MSINLFEAFSKPTTIVGGRASATQERKIQPINVVEPPRYSGLDYAKEYMKKEQESYMQYDKNKPRPPLGEDDRRGERMSEVDTATDYVSEMTFDDRMQGLKTYDEFNFDTVSKSCSLPIHEEKDAILSLIDGYRATIIRGNTGCGKTTQVPQFILDQHRERGLPCRIIVTQPRRIAAISVANRVCKERDWKLGTVVGYQIGQHRELCDGTRITYCTTGVLLQKLIAEKRIPEYTHVILDEVHERDAEMDFLLILIRRYVNTSCRDTKVILMSATINTDAFSEYFTITHGKIKNPAPVHKIKDKSQYQVRVFYLRDLYNLISDAKSMMPEGDSPDITKTGYTTAVKVVMALDQLEKNTAEKKQTKIEAGAVLIFLPGLFEIEEMKKHLSNHTSDVNQWWIVPLHSSITTEEQDKVFHNPPENHRKIVLSTNIAESSITVPDVRYVIDFCLTKVVVTDPQTNLASLQLTWASKNSLIQRAGRSGRVGDGRVYRLIEKEFYNELEEEATPEMLRCPLDRLVLQAKLLDSGTPVEIFSLAMNQPDLRNIEQTILSLKEIGALAITTAKAGNLKKPGRGYIDDLDGELTWLGHTIAKLPMDVRLGKLIFFGDLFHVLDECIIMACAMSVKNMFSSPFQEYLNAYNSKLAWSSSTCSDCIAYLHAYRVWRNKKAENLFRGKSDEMSWCRKRFLQVKILREIAVLHTDVRQRLKSLNQFAEEKERPKLDNVERNLFIKLALAAAFYPNYFLRGSHSGKVDEKQAVATLSGYDPYSTVYLQGMPNNQHGILYEKTIKKHFEDIASRVNVHFDHGSKVLVNFSHYAVEGTSENRQQMTIPGKIDLSVYRAVKMRQINPEIRIPVLNASEADRRVQNYLQQYDKMKKGHSNRMLSVWPWNKSLDTHTLPLVTLRLTNVESPTRFWARYFSENENKQFHNMNEFLNRPQGVRSLAEDEKVKIGNIYASKLQPQGGSCEYYRCRVESYKHFNGSYGISFIDVGEGKPGVSRNEIKVINDVENNGYDKIPDLATEFALVKIQPAKKDNGKWDPKANKFLERFKRITDHKKRLVAQIYSMVNNVARIKLYYCRGDQSLKGLPTINDELIEKKLADRSEEPFLSKQDHEERKNISETFEAGNSSLAAPRSLTEKEKLIEKLTALDIEEPDRSQCRQEVILKGPFSPLEMRVFSATKCSMAKLAIIERNSVNSVLLDTNPTDEYERMIIASYVGINPSRNKLSLRDTTVLPSLPGLPALVCLLFSPMVEMRCDPEFTRFTGALCGLGYAKKSKRPLNGDKDMEMVFDVEITLEDLVKINRVRYWLNLFHIKDAEVEDENRKEGYVKLRQYINELVWHNWKAEELHYTTQAHKWGQIPSERLMNPCTDTILRDIDEPADDLSCVFRLIWGVELNEDKRVQQERIRKNLKSLKEFSAGALFVKEVECQLCQITLPNRMNARLHLKSSLHKARAMKYLDPCDKNSDSRSEASNDYNGY